MPFFLTSTKSPSPKVDKLLTQVREKTQAEQLSKRQQLEAEKQERIQAENLAQQKALAEKQAFQKSQVDILDCNMVEINGESLNGADLLALIKTLRRTQTSKNGPVGQIFSDDVFFPFKLVSNFALTPFWPRRKNIDQLQLKASLRLDEADANKLFEALKELVKLDLLTSSIRQIMYLESYYGETLPYYGLEVPSYALTRRGEKLLKTKGKTLPH